MFCFFIILQRAVSIGMGEYDFDQNEAGELARIMTEEGWLKLDEPPRIKAEDELQLKTDKWVPNIIYEKRFQRWISANN